MDIRVYFLVIILALSPAIEVRGAIPVGIAGGLDPFVVFIVAFFTALIPAPILVYGLSYIEEKILPPLFSRINILEKIYRKTVMRARNKAERIRRSRYTYVALALFVGVPSPGTGVWTGSLISYILNLDKTRSLIAISVGNLIASIIVLLVSLGLKIVFT